MTRVSLTLGLLLLVLGGCTEPAPPDCPPGCLSSGSWYATEWANAWESYDDWAQPGPAVTSSGGIVADAAFAPGAVAGAAALEAGGSAADAVLTAALTSVVGSMGAPVSLAGVSALIYFDADSGSTYFLDGGWKTVAGEADLPSVPQGAPSGRAILVPGFMAAAQAAHDRFGRLPFRALFEPAIHLAEEGFELSEIAIEIERSQEVLGRLPETRAIFTKDDGAWLGEGDTLRQPELAETLRRLSAEGAAYMYEGPWAQRLVDAVRRDGGQMTLDDMASYQAVWSKTTHIDYGPYQVHVPGSTGGAALLEALQLADRAGMRTSGPVAQSAESLYWMSRIGYLLWVADFRSEEFAGAFPGLKLDPESRVTPEHADGLWGAMQGPGWDEFVAADPYSASASSLPAHTDAIVAADRWGNVAALIYTSNQFGWGDTGLFVDGVSVPDAGTLELIRNQPGLTPGHRVDNWLNPVVVLSEGRPVVSVTALGSGIHHATVQTLLNVLDYGMAPQEAVAEPQAVHFAWPGAPGVPPGTPIHSHLVREGAMPAAMLDSVRGRGQPIVEVPPAVAGMLKGQVSLLQISPGDGTIRGVASPGGAVVVQGRER